MLNFCIFAEENDPVLLFLLEPEHMARRRPNDDNGSINEQSYVADIGPKS